MHYFLLNDVWKSLGLKESKMVMVVRSNHTHQPRKNPTTFDNFYCTQSYNRFKILHRTIRTLHAKDSMKCHGGWLYRQYMPYIIFLDSWLWFKEKLIKIFSLESNNYFETNLKNVVIYLARTLHHTLMWKFWLAERHPNFILFHLFIEYQKN